MDRAAPGALVATAFAMLCFAANSLLCRGALGTKAIDPASFTAIRIASGAALLAMLAAATGRRGGGTGPGAVAPRATGGSMRAAGGWERVTRAAAPAAMLFLYAVAFSYAYVSLTVGTGALILFGTVQASLVLAALYAGERPRPLQWTGLGVAVAGLVYLVMPGLSAPPPGGAALMAVAGLAWTAYTLLGRTQGDPLAATARAFTMAIPLVVITVAAAWGRLQVAPAGVLLAVASGAIASGLGYVAWYAALGGLTNTQAAAVQLSVPAIAAAGGILLLGEAITLRLLVAATAILGGVALTFRRTISVRAG